MSLSTESALDAVVKLLERGVVALETIAETDKAYAASRSPPLCTSGSIIADLLGTDLAAQVLKDETSTARWSERSIKVHAKLVERFGKELVEMWIREVGIKPKSIPDGKQLFALVKKATTKEAMQE